MLPADRRLEPLTKPVLGPDLVGAGLSSVSAVQLNTATATTARRARFLKNDSLAFIQTQSVVLP
jgi:hypothetical protein